MVDGVAVVGLDRAEVRRLVERREQVRKLSTRDLGLAAAARVDGATTVAATISLAAVGRRVGHGDRRHRRGAPRRGRDVRRVRGPRGALADPGARRRLGGQVDPRRAGDARAPRHLRRPGRGLPDDARSPASTSATRASRSRWSVETPEDAARAFLAHLRARARGHAAREPDPRRTPRWTRSCTPASSPTASTTPTRAGSGARTSRPFLLAHFASESGGESVAANVALVLVERGARGARRRGDRRRRLAVTRPDGRAASAPPPRVVVVGDVMVDVLVEVRAPFAHASDTPSRIADGAWRVGGEPSRCGSRGPVHAAALVAGRRDRRLRGQPASTPSSTKGVDVVGRRAARAAHGHRGRARRARRPALDADGPRREPGARAAAASKRRSSGLCPSDHVHVSGYCLLDERDAPPARGLRAAERRRATGGRRSVDASSTGPLRALGPARFLALGSGATTCSATSRRDVCSPGRRGARRRCHGARRRPRRGRSSRSVRAGARVAAGDGCTLEVPPWPTDAERRHDRGGGRVHRDVPRPSPRAASGSDAAPTAATAAAASAVAEAGARRWGSGYSRE